MMQRTLFVLLFATLGLTLGLGARARWLRPEVAGARGSEGASPGNHGSANHGSGAQGFGDHDPSMDPDSTAQGNQGAPDTGSSAGESTSTQLPDGVVDLENSICPVMGFEVEEPGAYFLDFRGVRIHFCCGGCDQRVLDDPGQAMAALLEEGIELPTELRALADAEED